MTTHGTLSARAWDAFGLTALVSLVALGAIMVPARLSQARALRDRADAAGHLLAKVQSDEAEQLREQAKVLQTAGTTPAPERASDVVRAVHAAARAMRVELSALRPVPDPDASWSLHVEFEGRFADIGFFLALLEGEPLSASVPVLRLETAPRGPTERGPRRVRGLAEITVSIPPAS